MSACAFISDIVERVAGTSRHGALVPVFTHQFGPPVDLPTLATEAMRDEGFEPAFPPEALAQANEVSQALPYESARDLRHLPWSSIDNETSRDLDQIEVAEALPDGSFRLFVGIADVDAFVPRGTPVDHHAWTNTTSVYTGAVTFPMLPERFSTDLTSLVPDRDRAALVVEMVIGADGLTNRCDVYPALVRNQARLAYDTAGPWLEGSGAIPKAIARVDGMADQLKLQDRIAGQLRAQRERAGALEFETTEPTPVIANGQVVGITAQRKNRARVLIENFMIAANVSLASFLQERGVPSIQRIVRNPERWPKIVEIAADLGTRLPSEPDARALSAFLRAQKREDPDHFPDLSLSIVKLLGRGEYAVVGGDPSDSAWPLARDGATHVSGTVPPILMGQGHFGLAVKSYTHSTAPNRRYPDLLIQRMVKALLAGMPAPYPRPDLESLANRCSEREHAAEKVERRMRKVVAAVAFGHQIGQHFDAIITGHSRKGTYLRTLDAPVEGKLVGGDEGVDVGDRIRVRLVGVDPLKGHIDFVRS